MIQRVNDDPPVLHDPETPRRHAVDAPVCDALVVADRDGEAAVVGAHDADDVALARAPDVDAVALARVLRQVRVAPLRILLRLRHPEQRQVEVCKREII